MFICFLNRSGRGGGGGGGWGGGGGGSLLVALNIRSAYQVHHMVTGECYRQQHNAVSIYNHGHPMDAMKRVPTYYRMLFTGYTRHPHPPSPPYNRANERVDTPLWHTKKTTGACKVKRGNRHVQRRWQRQPRAVRILQQMCRRGLQM
jgi:hypothetical protein